ETAKTAYETFNRVYSTGEPTQVFGWELLRKDGQKRYVETSVSLVRDETGGPVGFRGIARDITEKKALEKTRERIINHLSHELGTPLSLIEGALWRISSAVESADLNKIRSWVQRARRSVSRLNALREEIDDILNERPMHERERILHLIEAALGLVEEFEEESLKEGAKTIRQKILRRLESLFMTEEVKREFIQLDTLLREVFAEATQLIKDRQVEVVAGFESGIRIEMNRKALKKVCHGFLRNAIENTPDEGKIEVKVTTEDGLVRIDFQDFGTGITSENQKLIFGGFIHTQDTHRYASKKPYVFNAGGSGSDLLRAKVLSERFNFNVGFSSQRCRHLPRDKDECPGRISSCPFIDGREECLSSGGSTFSLSLPLG
ncbi:MAG: PAS domain S-box protein, partial [Desulfatiglandaceae bacterium]